MRKIIRFFKYLLGRYEVGYEYWININDIKIPKHIKNNKIKPHKWHSKLKHWLETGEFESFILLRRDFTLVDGYSSYLIAEKYDLEFVPVYFIN